LVTQWTVGRVARDEVIEQRVELRRARQRRVEEGEFAVWAILDEASLRRLVGGPQVLREQLAHLLKLAELPNVTLQVIPFDKGAHIAAGTAFSLLKFADYPGVVYIDNLTGSVYADEEPDVERYTLVMDHLRATAVDPSDSIVMVKRVIAEL
jgi:hypothetical protein